MKTERKWRENEKMKRERERERGKMKREKDFLPFSPFPLFAL